MEAIFKEKQEEIAFLIVRIMNYCIRKCYSLKRWCQIVNTLIFKESGNYQVHRLRVIHLFEADLNLLYSVKWRQLVRKADHEQIIHPGQYGGRPGYEATSLALLEELRLDISYMTRRTMLTLDNDAASCYDRIVINLASLINRKYGLHQELTKLHGTLLQKTEYKVSTAAGISTSSYTNSSVRPLYGTGQGAGNSPAIWLLISSMLFDTFDTKSHGALFASPDNTVRVKLGLTGFVDDTNVVVNGFHPQTDPPLPQIVPLLQQDAQLWTDLLYMSGGKLELSKCSYHSLHFKFLADGTPVAIQNPCCPDLDLIDPANAEKVSVRFLPSTTPHKILGHWKAPVDPRQKNQIQALMEKAHRQSILIAMSPLSRQGAWLAYNGKYVASLRYILPQCWFSHTTLLASEKKSMHRIISKCGYARTTPTSLLYAPTEYAGAGFLHWHTIQGEGQIKHFIKHWRATTQLSKMLRIAVSWSQWQAGISTSILTDVSTPLPHLECRWISSLRDFLATIQGHIDLDSSYTVPCDRTGDVHIMDFAIQSKAFTPKELTSLNYCRLYMHVTTISELANAKGTHVMPHMFECERPPWFSGDTNVVIQARPSLYQQHYQWQRLCRMLCTENLKLGLHIQLGKLTSNAHTTPRLRREAYIERNQAPSLYIWKNNHYWTAQPHAYLPQQFELVEPSEWTPSEITTPIDIQQWHTPRRCSIVDHMGAPSNVPSEPIGVPCDFEEYTAHFQKWERDLLLHIQWLKSPFELMHFIHTECPPNDSLLVVSDGSAIPKRTMSFGVVIGTPDGISLVEAMGPAFGVPSSHRAECTGCLAGALILKHLQQFTRIQFPETMEVQIISDNQSMINSLKERATYTTPYSNTTLAPDWDLLEEIHNTYSTSWKGARHVEWIRGHQDQTTQIENLPIEAQLNVRADHLAGEFLIMVDATSKVTTPVMSHTKCVLYIQARAIHGQYTTAIRRSASLPPFLHYLRQRHEWSQSTIDNIDWEPFQQATRTAPSSDIHLLKLVHEKLPTNYQRSRYYPWIKSQCHFCSQPETFDHLCLSSCNSHSTDFRRTLVDSITTYCQATNTPGQFQDTFLDAVQMWFSSIDDNVWTQWRGPSLLLQCQRAIGWKQMFRGFLSKEWRTFLVRCIRHDQIQQWHTSNSYPSTIDDSTSSGTDDEDEYVVTFADLSAHTTSYSWHLDPTRHLAKMICIVWLEMSQLWLTHLQFIHKDSPTSSPAKNRELRNQIIALHTLKPHTLADHRDRYFFSDVEAYLERATNGQMQRYISRYRPVILHSIKIATRIATTASPLTTFPGFSMSTTSPRMDIHTPQEETPHRKHTRIRSMITQSITKFFSCQPPRTNPP